MAGMYEMEPQEEEDEVPFMPLRPKLADWYVNRYVRRGEVSRESNSSVHGHISTPDGRDSYFRDSGAVIESSVIGTDEFPLPDDRIRLNMFEPLKVLGRGAIGTVYLVLLLGTDRVFAMKQLKKSDMIMRNKVQRVMTERDIYRTANHPFIVSMYSSFQTQKKLYFVMEYCAGGEFFRHLQKQPDNRLSEEAAKFYAAEVILALEYLHCLGIVYRDLKPENVLMRSNGHIALTDFDLSKAGDAQSLQVIRHVRNSSFSKLRRSLSFKGDKGKSKLFDLEIVDSEPILSRSHSFVGTEEYLAPEVIEGKSQSAAVDWWTVGILIYEMICGHSPFRDEGQNKTFARILHGDITWPSDVHVSTECKNIVRELLQKDPNKRLGKIHGASELKKHRWFKGLNFDLIRNERPPMKPKLRDPLDLSQYKNLEQRFEENELEISDDGDDGSNDMNPFANFNSRKGGHQQSY